jgi:hypothetical protein
MPMRQASGPMVSAVSRRSRISRDMRYPPGRRPTLCAVAYAPHEVHCVNDGGGGSCVTGPQRLVPPGRGSVGSWLDLCGWGLGLSRGAGVQLCEIGRESACAGEREVRVPSAPRVFCRSTPNGPLARGATTVGAHDAQSGSPAVVMTTVSAHVGLIVRPDHRDDNGRRTRSAIVCSRHRPRPGTRLRSASADTTVRMGGDRGWHRRGWRVAGLPGRAAGCDRRSARGGSRVRRAEAGACGALFRSGFLAPGALRRVWLFGALSSGGSRAVDVMAEGWVGRRWWRRGYVRCWSGARTGPLSLRRSWRE